MRRPTFAWLLLLLALGCASAPVPAPPPAPPAVAVPPGGTVPVTELTDDVRWVAASAEYRAAVWQAFALATHRIGELAAGREPGTWAVSVDADETVLGNIQYEIERQPYAFEFDRDAWKAWVERREAVALPGAREFLHRVHELGGRVVVVTNRRADEAAATEDNLRALDLPYDLVLPRNGDSEKEPRWQAVEEGTAAPGLPPLEILLWVGDNVGDFPDLDQSLATAPETALAAFGDRFVVVPNPMYGSWKE